MTRIPFLLSLLLLAASARADDAMGRGPLVASTGDGSEARARLLPVTPLNVSLLPPLDTQGLAGRRTRNRVALGVLAARTWGLDGVGVSAGANWSEGTVRGGQVAGLANVSRGDLRGLQASVGANVAFADARGVQAATLVNDTRGAFQGLQISGTVNRVGATMRGGQLSSGVNVSRDLYGTQLGLLNIAQDVSGLQLGVVNVGRVVTGVQLGLLNISDEATASIGLLNVVRRGRLNLELWGDDVAPANLGVRYGGRWVHAVVQTGAAPFRGSFRTQMLLGVGLSLPVARPLALDVDLSFGTWRRKLTGGAPENGLARLRVVGAWSLQRRLAVMAGVSLNAYAEPDAGEDDADLSFMPARTVGGGDSAVRLWPGLMVGVRI